MGKQDSDIDDAVDKAVECFCMAKVLEKRIRFFEITNKVLSFMGISLPVCMSFVAANTDQFNNWDKFAELISTSPLMKSAAIIIIFIAAVIQAILSACSIVFKWDDKFQKYKNWIIQNHKYAKQYHKIYKWYYDDEETNSKLLEETNKAYAAQEEINIAMNITDEERRYGTRCAYIKYKIECKICGETPIYIKTKSTCPVCGKYPPKETQWKSPK